MKFTEVQKKLTNEKHNTGLLRIECGKQVSFPDTLGLYEENGIFFIYETDDQGKVTVLDEGTEEKIVQIFYNRVLKEEERYLLKE
jgi:hypothetical protein